MNVPFKGNVFAVPVASRSLASPATQVRTLIASGLTTTVLMLGGCASVVPSEPAASSYPLKACDDQLTTGCVVRLFIDDTAALRRDSASLPAHYLELNEPQMWPVDCQAMVDSQRTLYSDLHSSDTVSTCERRLRLLMDRYFKREVAPDEIGLAFEGGGSKSAPFALGVLAALIEEHSLFQDVSAISSVSGGTYAASFYFNRLLDVKDRIPHAGTVDEWFASCVPDYFLIPTTPHRSYPSGDFFGKLASSGMLPPRCWETDPHNPSKSLYNEFDAAYEFQGQVWKYHDLVMTDDGNNLQIKHWYTLGPEILNTTALSLLTIGTIPLQFVTRSVFRWPENTAPSKVAYRHGLQRQFGYSPYVWYCLTRKSCPQDSSEKIDNRRLEDLASIESKPGFHVPFWIINATAATEIGTESWLVPAHRDPIRQTYEITPDESGSGAYGYAIEAPREGFNLLQVVPRPIPILDAVVTSAAFLDDDETSWDTQPNRLVANSALHFLNLTWFSETVNPNVGNSERARELLTPWPFYFKRHDEESMTPYIHLQDGGNAENSGVFSLLRRGYRRIIFAHSGTDATNTFSEMCHLKNQFEMDGTYRIDSDDLERIMASLGSVHLDPSVHLQTYLDQLCSEQLSSSDLKTFDGNIKSSDPSTRTAMGRVICSRFHPEHSWTPRNVEQSPCAEYRLFQDGKWSEMPRAYPEELDLFHKWSGASIRFIVTRMGIPVLNEAPVVTVSTIILIAPSIRWEDFRGQLTRSHGGPMPQSWVGFCDEGRYPRDEFRITSCRGPKNQLFRDQVGTADPKIPCGTAGYLLANSCSNEPTFPQDDYIAQTWHTDYIEFSAYFDLGRNEMWRAIESVREAAISQEARGAR